MVLTDHPKRLTEFTAKLKSSSPRQTACCMTALCQSQSIYRTLNQSVSALWVFFMLWSGLCFSSQQQKNMGNYKCPIAIHVVDTIRFCITTNLFLRIKLPWHDKCDWQPGWCRQPADKSLSVCAWREGRWAGAFNRGLFVRAVNDPTPETSPYCASGPCVCFQVCMLWWGRGCTHAVKTPSALCFIEI